MIELEKRMQAVLDEISEYLAPDTEGNVRELLVHGEAGIALELLCTQLVEFDIAIPMKIKEQLAVFAEDMGMEVSELQELKAFTGVSRDGFY
ncbi:MafI family immunity protein [Achromobacter deleyi]|uniref:MafI family immunity protein n=1 Tax=Achromobacter deleyi TaxID=1353891 RepID=A0A7T4E5P7_9BURK|nr:MafI family immunity protein [Achromobacter deleyi]QQB36364.1 MafI family immunity protein [Achromobacter deleyi]